MTITGLDPDTEVAEGIYQAVCVEGERESAKVDIPVFKTLPIAVTGVTLSPKTSTAVAGTAGNRQLSATVTPANATNKTVTFSIAPETPGLSVTSGGNIAWTDAVPDGEYTTTATTADGSKTDTHVLTLTKPEEG